MKKGITFQECVGSCMEKIKEHKELKELYKKLVKEDEEKIAGEILTEKIEDYHQKVKCYLLELLDELKANEETYESLHEGEQKEQVRQDLEDLKRDLYCSVAEILELFHYFRTLESLSDKHLEQALSIPIKLIYELLLELKCHPK